MIQALFRKYIQVGVIITSVCFCQDIPINSPHLLPFPAVHTGLSYYSLIPTQNFQVSPGIAGWGINDTISGLLTSFDIEILRYRWWDHFQFAPQYDAYSSLTYSTRKQFDSQALPPGYPSTLEVNGRDFSDFSMNMAIRGVSLDNYFVYDFSHRGSVVAKIGLGVSHLSFYENPDGVRVLDANGYNVNFGLGWRFTLFGRLGKRFRLGLELGYGLQGFDLSNQGDDLKLPPPATGSVTPIQSIALNTPDLKVTLELGEALFSAYTPFRDPYKLGLLNLSGGGGSFQPEEGVNIRYDSTTAVLSIPFSSSISQNYDLQLIKYNWPFHFIRQANIDALSGIGIRWWKMSVPISLPQGWASSLTDGNTNYSALKFAPRITNIYLDNEIVYPLGSRLYSKVRGGVGYGSLTLYENIVLDRLIDASALSWHIGTGVGFTMRGDGSSKVALGLNVEYYHQAFEIDMAASDLSPVYPEDVIPITFIDLSQPIISLSIGLIFGGYPNAGMKAHEEFKKKNFTRALELQEELLNFNPNHHNKQALLIQMKMVQDSLVAKYYRDVRSILSQGKVQDAYTLITRGEKPPGQEIERAVEQMKVEIADKSLKGAAQALKMLDFQTGEDFILLALKSDPSSYSIAKVLLSRSYIIRATILYTAGVYERSLYWLKQADGLTDRYRFVTEDLRKKIADGKLDDANAGILKEDRHMALESMMDAKSLDPNLAYLVDKHIKDLDEAIEYADEQRIAPMKRMALENLLDEVGDLTLENFVPKVGMKGSLIVRYVGPPERKFKEGDYDLYVYPKSETMEIWLFLRNGSIEKIEYQNK